MPEKNWKILIVDGDDFLRDINADVFRQAKFEVLEASDGEEGLELALQHLPDVVLTGIDMPRVTGFEMVKKFQQHPRTDKIPFFIFSHFGHEADRATALSLGARGFLVKGMVKPAEIIRQVTNLLIGQTLRVAVNTEILDGQILSSKLGKNIRPILELTAEPEKGENIYRAKLLSE